MPTHIQIKRVYDEPNVDDGYRVLVDRLWPRGVKKESLPMDRWCKELAPSPELRIWFDHRADRFAMFAKKYRDELKERHALAMEVLVAVEDVGMLTLLYAAKDPICNHAVVLRDALAALAEQ